MGEKPGIERLGIHIDIAEHGTSAVTSRAKFASSHECSLLIVEMSHEKLRIHNTPLDNIVANLRGELGEITQSWLLMRRLMAASAVRRVEKGVDEFGDPELNMLYALRDRLEGDMVARLAELAEPKIGRLTFYFASKKLKDRFDREVDTFSRFIKKNRFTEKRNAEISHKELPEQWSNRAPIHLPYPILVKALALATRLMKKIDRVAVGPEARFFWGKLRKRRYDPTFSAHAEFMIAPYIKLTAAERGAVLDKEARDGKAVWEPMPTTINGQPATVIVNKKWAGILMGPKEVMFLDVYPLTSLGSIETGDVGTAAPPSETGGA